MADTKYKGEICKNTHTTQRPKFNKSVMEWNCPLMVAGFHSKQWVEKS